MTQSSHLPSLRTFLIIWGGQMISSIGSYMTSFAMTLWAWELTQQATALVLVGFFTQVPRVLVTPFAGIIVDRWSRKTLMVLGDTVAVLSSLAVLLLYTSDHLQLWHLYVTGAVNAVFGQIQELAYLASIPLLVPKQHQTRASSLGSVLHYGPSIIAPALAGALYGVIGLQGILTIDIITFLIGIGLMVPLPIPQPQALEDGPESRLNLWQEISFGLRYIWQRPSLFALLASGAGFWFVHDLGGALYAPMILARTGNDSATLGTVVSAAGVGGVMGAVIISVWGGPKRRIHGYFLGMIGAGCSKTIFGLSNSVLGWVPAQVCSSVNFPLLGSANDAIWFAKVQPKAQGRVLAVPSLVKSLTTPLAYLLAGPLADQVFEPAMRPGGALAGWFGGWVGTGPGAGMALFYVGSSLGLLLIGLTGYAIPNLRHIETLVPDHDAPLQVDSSAVLSDS